MRVLLSEIEIHAIKIIIYAFLNLLLYVTYLIIDIVITIIQSIYKIQNLRYALNVSKTSPGTHIIFLTS